MKYYTMPHIKQLILASLLINILTPTNSICAAAENWENDTKEASEIEQPAVARGLWRARPAVANIVPVGGEVPARASNQPSPKGYGGHGHGWRGHNGNKQPTSQHVAQANLALYHALSANNLPLARQALENDADPNMPPNSTLYFKAKHWLLYNKYMPKDPLKYPHFFTNFLPFVMIPATGISYAIPTLIYKLFSNNQASIPLRIAVSLSVLPLYILTVKAGLYYYNNRYETIKADCEQKHQHMMALGTPPLLYHDNPDAIKMLLDYKANVDIQNNRGKTALTHAAEKYYSYLSRNGFLAPSPRKKQLAKKIKILTLAGTHLNQSLNENAFNYTQETIEKAQRIREKITKQLQKPKALLQHEEWFNPPLPITLKQIIASYMLSYRDDNDEDINWLIKHLMRTDKHLAPLLTFSSHY